MTGHRAAPEQWGAMYEGAFHCDAESACLLELRARVEALEAAQNQPARAVTDPVWTDTPAPAGSLVERVRKAIKHEFDYDARAAIREVAAWLSQESEGHLGSGAHWAGCLQQEAER